MKFDSTALPLVPTPQQLTELDELLVSANELHRFYSALEHHPRVQGSAKSTELFCTCREQLANDIAIISQQLESILSIPGGRESTAPRAASAGIMQDYIPGVESAEASDSLFETVRRVFQLEDRFDEQLNFSLRSAQGRKHLKLELQLKMIILSAAQRARLLEDRYGFAKSKTVLFQGLRRQTTRFLSALNGEERPDLQR